MAISASGLAASAARFSTAASKITQSFTGGPAPKVPGPQPAAPAQGAGASVAGSPLSGGTALAAQQQDEPASWMVELLQAKTAYKANAAVMKVAEKMAHATIDMIS